MRLKIQQKTSYYLADFLLYHIVPSVVNPLANRCIIEGAANTRGARCLLLLPPAEAEGPLST